MSDIKLGQLIEGEANRDAIHIAVAPVVAAHTLTPGCHVGLLTDGTASSAETPIGIVDPFLFGNLVRKGERFWLVLYPGTITGLRHEWTHPAFTGDKAASERWLRAYATSFCLYDDDATPESAFDTFMDRVRRGEIFYQGSSLHSLDQLKDAKELFKHLSVYLNRAVGAEDFIYTCSC